MFIALLIAGMAGYRALPIKLYPDVSFPIVQVSVLLSGAAASEVETQVTRPVEAAVSNVAGVKHVQSTVTQGVSSTTRRVRDRRRPAEVDRRGALGSRPHPLQPAARHRAADRAALRRRLGAARDLRGVDRHDVRHRAELVRRRHDRARADRAHRRGPGRSGRRRRARDQRHARPCPARSAGAHRARRSTTRCAARASTCPAADRKSAAASRRCACSARPRRCKALRDLVIPTGAGRDVRLSDVANVASGAAERRGFATLNGRSVVGFQVKKTKAASDVAVAREVALGTEQLAAQYPGMRFRAHRLDRRQHAEQLLRHAQRAARRHGAGVHRGAALPARLARDADRRRGHAGVADPDLRGDELRWAFRST